MIKDAESSGSLLRAIFWPVFAAAMTVGFVDPVIANVSLYIRQYSASNSG
jgi:hypothetical protein